MSSSAEAKYQYSFNWLGSQILAMQKLLSFENEWCNVLLVFIRQLSRPYKRWLHILDLGDTLRIYIPKAYKHIKIHVTFVLSFRTPPLIINSPNDSFGTRPISKLYHSGLIVQITLLFNQEIMRSKYLLKKSNKLTQAAYEYGVQLRI